MESSDHKNIIYDLEQVYNRAYKYTTPYWTRAEEYSDAYESVIDPNNWPTMSEVVFPYHFIAVENALPFMVDYLFPRTNFMNLRPRSSAVPYDVIRRAEAYYTHLITEKLRVREEGVKAIKDALKMGNGYMRTKLDWFTPKTDGLVVAWANGVPVSERKVIEGEREIGVGIEYVPFGQVLSVGNGDTPQNGEHIIVSYVTYRQLQEMYEDDKSREKSMWMSENNPEFIMNEARDNHYDHSIVPNAQVMGRLAGQNIQPDRNQSEQMDDSVMIPIVEFYLRGKVVHVANGRDIVYMQETGRDIESGLVKATTCPNSGNWFSDSNIKASMNLAYGSNTLYNAIFDTMTMSLYPTRVVNTSMLQAGREIPRHEPWSTIEVNGPVRDAISYPQGPPMPQGIMEMGGVLQQFHAQATGQPLANQGMGSPGMVRSGVTAFESLMETPMGREKMSGALLEMNFLKPLIQNIINLSQILIGDEETFMTTESPEMPNPDEVNEFGFKHVSMTVTRDDLVRDWAFDLYLDSKLRNSMSDQVQKGAMFDRFKDDPSIDQNALRDHFIGDERLSARLRATPEQEQETLQRLQQQAQMQAQAAAGPSQGPQPGQDPNAQGMNGIMANA